MIYMLPPLALADATILLRSCFIRSPISFIQIIYISGKLLQDLHTRSLGQSSGKRKRLIILSTKTATLMTESYLHPVVDRALTPVNETRNVEDWNKVNNFPGVVPRTERTPNEL